MILLQTILHRPYVFAFLAAFLFLGRIYWGWRKTFLWLVIGYIAAWTSEVSSIHNGFPYGIYHYIYENMKGELMVAGVPFWDSLSYPFMIFAGYTTARFILGESTSLRAAVFGAFLTMLLDIIIDPLTVQGEKWFLGKIYYYPDGGQYFGVPLTNFFGWFVVPLAVILIFQLVNRFNLTTYKLSNLVTCLYPIFYLSIALFNIVITIFIGDPLLASVDCVILIPIIYLVKRRVKKLSLTNSSVVQTSAKA